MGFDYGSPQRVRNLSTFTTERFQIKLPPSTVAERGCLEEAIWLMRRHFFRTLTEDSWNNLIQEARNYGDPSTAVAVLMSRFGCSYTRHIPQAYMEERQSSIRGETGHTGLVLCRPFLSAADMKVHFLHTWKCYMAMLRTSCGTFKKSLTSNISYLEGASATRGGDKNTVTGVYDNNGKNRISDAAENEPERLGFRRIIMGKYHGSKAPVSTAATHNTSNAGNSETKEDFLQDDSLVYHGSRFGPVLGPMLTPLAVCAVSLEGCNSILSVSYSITSSTCENPYLVPSYFDYHECMV